MRHKMEQEKITGDIDQHNNYVKQYNQLVQEYNALNKKNVTI